MIQGILLLPGRKGKLRRPTAKLHHCRGSFVGSSLTCLCGKNFYVCGILTDGRRNRMKKSLEMRVFLKLNKDILYVHVVTLKYFLVFTALKLIIIWKTKIRSKIN